LNFKNSVANSNTLSNKGKETDRANAEQLNLSPNRGLKFQRYEHIFISCRVQLRFLGLMGAVRESVELLYQNDSDYLFDSSKFDKAFDFKAISYSQGIQENSEVYEIILDVSGLQMSKQIRSTLRRLVWEK